jgi:integrase
METSYEVTVWSIATYEGKRQTTYYVRWKVGRKSFKKPFKTYAFADSFRSELVTASRKGEPFDLKSGLPASKVRAMGEADRSNATWFPFAARYAEEKWADISPNHRRGIAEALTNITMALLTTRRGKPADAILRHACKTTFSVNLRQRLADEDTAQTIRWLDQNTMPVGDLAKPDVLRGVLKAVGSKLDGEPAATSTTRRKRMTLHNALDFAVQQELLGKNPLTDTKVTRPNKTAVLRQVDRRAVINPVQARTLLEAVRRQGKSNGCRLVAFFGLMYYAALRPEEAAALRKDHLSLPSMNWNEELERWEPTENNDGWGELHLERARPEVSAEWTDSQDSNEERGLKHRDPSEGRTVPCPPALTALLHDHLATHGTASDGRLFWGARSQGRIGSTVYGRAWASARATVFTPAVNSSLLAKRPYDLRHAAVSTWIKAGVEITRVADWAGHSVAVLMHVYAKFIDGGEQAARARVETALRG